MSEISSDLTVRGFFRALGQVLLPSGSVAGSAISAGSAGQYLSGEKIEGTHIYSLNSTATSERPTAGRIPVSFAGTSGVIVAVRAMMFEVPTTAGQVTVDLVKCTTATSVTTTVLAAPISITSTDTTCRDREWIAGTIATSGISAKDSYAWVIATSGVSTAIGEGLMCQWVTRQAPL